MQLIWILTENNRLQWQLAENHGIHGAANNFGAGLAFMAFLL